MGQKVSPIGFRTGVTIGWKSRWFAPKANFGEFLVEDAKVREFIDQRLNRRPPYAAISAIEIERTREEVKVILRTARPGLVIGPRGAEVDRLKSVIEDMTNRHVNINIVEVKNPDLDAQLVAAGIAEQLKRRASFRRAMKQRAEATMQAGAKGVKIQISGRLGGAEMCRSETQIKGSIPLHTLEADVDYGFATSYTTYGTIGVKVWIHRGMFGEAPVEEDQVARRAMTRARRRRESGDETRGRREGPRGPRKGSRRRSTAAHPPAPVEPPSQGAPASAEAPADSSVTPDQPVSKPHTQQQSEASQPPKQDGSPEREKD